MINVTSFVSLYLVGAYLIGALPTGYWISKWAGIHDIRRLGSGNIGATNVARILGFKFFFIVLAFDCFKAYFYLTLGANCGVSSTVLMLSAFMLIIGNGYSIFLNGSGGKGVATMVGILLAIHPLLLIGLLGTWLLVVWYLQNVGMASVVTACMAPWYALLLSGIHGFILLIGMALWVLWRHRDNIRIFYFVR